MMLFLDTEWADTMPDGCHLVSLGLVGRDDGWHWYAERDPLPSSAPDFVRCVVYPLLERGAYAMRDRQMAESLHAFIARVARETGKTPTVAYDHWNDRAMFGEAWYGPFGQLADIPPPPVHWFDLNALNPNYNIGLEGYFSEHAEERKRRHHALVDARAARAGYLHAVRELVAKEDR